jgi:hypothetical protein
VSRICARLDEIVGAFRTRQLDHVEFPYVYLDATYLHVRNTTSQVVSTQEPTPEPLVFGVTDVAAQDLAVAVGGDPGGDQAAS